MFTGIKSKKLLNKSRAYSLVEVLVTLAIFAILTVMLINVLILNLRISKSISNRTRIRSELNELASLLERDIRNSSVVDTCGPVTVAGNNTEACSFTITSSSPGPENSFTWVLNYCDNESGGKSLLSGVVCKNEGTALDTSLFRTSDILKIDSMTFEKLIDATNTERVTIIITINASARDATWKINNQVRQIIISTRNYRINLGN